MYLNWNEIRVRAEAFSREWADATYERGESQSFYNEFFDVFGIRRRSVARYEECVNKLDNTRGYIDLFWPGVLLVEQKSAGRDLRQAAEQAGEYFDALNEAEKPRYQLVCDFQTFELLDRETQEQWKFVLPELSQHVEKFGFILGRTPKDFTAQDDVSIAASILVGELYDDLKNTGYPNHELEMYLVRIVFCLFADDTGVFEPRDLFYEFLINRTQVDGSDTGSRLHHIFEILNTPENQRLLNLDEEIASFPYIDGHLFEDSLTVASFDSATREKLLQACEFNWSEISPAIFGSLFQSVMDPDKRRAIGAHYTTEQNILKVIEPLFMDDLKEEFKKICDLKRNRTHRLRQFQQKLSQLNFFDPACGCGNFLIIAYRELRRLEIEVLKQLQKVPGQLDLDAQNLSIIDVDQFFGIEIEEFPARIAETAMWMMDHIMNNELGLEFGTVYTRIPLSTQANIRCDDALEIQWDDVLPSSECNFVLGNPPFIGAKIQSAEQRAQVHKIAKFKHIKGTLDYVCCWFLKAAEYVKGDGRIGFVASNSITQGEQVGQLWPLLFDRYGLEISFAHRTFSWSSEARGAAHVHVIIVGLARRGFEPKTKRLFSYSGSIGISTESSHTAISPYLAPELERFPHVTVQSTKRPINGFLPLKTGSKPIDDGNYIFIDEAELDEFLTIEPDAEKFIRPYVGAKNLMQGTCRYILALQNATPNQLSQLPEVRKRIASVRKFREKSKSKPTIKLANTPLEYHINVLPDQPFLVIPVTTSERREFVPIGWLEPPCVPNVDTRILLDATLADFALLTSKMHMTWLRFVGGRLKSDYRYSISLVYNTFPRPEGNLERLNISAQAVLDERLNYQDTPVGTLYDPDLMPRSLRAAHETLDREVDRIYSRKVFPSERDRIEFLFERYNRYVQPLLNKKRGYKSFGRQVPENFLVVN